MNVDPSAAAPASFTGLSANVGVASGNSQNIGSAYGGTFYAEHNGSGTLTSLVGASAYSYSGSGHPVTNSYGAKVQAYLDGAAAAVYGADIEAVKDSAGAATNIYGVRAQAFRGGGTATNVYGIYAFGDGGAAVGAVNNFGVYASAGNATNSYGVYIADSSGTNQFGLYQSGANDKSHFAGSVGIGTTNPGYKLDVVGDVNVTGNFKVNGVNLATGGGDFKSDGSVPMTGGIRAIAGTSASAGIAFVGDTDTGLFSQGANDLSIATGGVERIRVSSAGNVGIGVLGGATGALEVRTSSTASPLRVSRGNNATNPANIDFTPAGALSGSNVQWMLGMAMASGAFDLTTWDGASVTPRMSVLPSGNVGIGLTNPARLLHVNGPMRLTAATTPASPVAGDIFIDSAASNALKYYNGSVWVSLTGGATNIDGLSDAKTDTQSVFLGTNAGLNDDGTNYNTAVGIDALKANISGFRNNAFGALSLSKTTGSFNDAFGFYTMQETTSGTNNAAFGSGSLSENRTGSYNAALGAGALAQQGGSNNVGIGFEAGKGTLIPSVSSNNVNIGYRSGYMSNGANNNVAVGYKAGYSSTTGSNNILIGYDVNASSDTASNEINIGDTIYGNITAGNVGIGTSNPGTKLQIAGVISPAADANYDLGTAALRFKNIYASNNVIQTSDARLKTDIKDSDLGLDFVNNLRPVSYHWREGDPKLHYGVIAQETEKAIREAKKRSGRENEIDNVIVTHDEQIDRYGVRYTELIAPMIKSIQELYSEIMGHDSRLATLEAKEAAHDRAIASVKAEADAKVMKLESENQALKARADKAERENAAIKAYLCAKDKAAAICK